MSKIVIYGADWCPDCIRAKKFYDSVNTEYEYIDLVAEPEKKEIAQNISGKPNIPVIVFPDGSILVEPTDEELKNKGI